MERRQCPECNTYYDSNGHCPRCWEMEQVRRITEESDQRREDLAREEERFARELAERQADFTYREAERREAAEREHSEQLDRLAEEKAERDQELADEAAERLKAIEKAARKRHKEAIRIQEEFIASQQREHQAAEQRHREMTENGWRLRAESRRRRAEELVEVGLVDDAIAEYLKAAEEDRSNFSVWCQLATAFRRRARVNESVGAVRKAIALLALNEHLDRPDNWRSALELIDHEADRGLLTAFEAALDGERSAPAKENQTT